MKMKHKSRGDSKGREMKEGTVPVKMKMKGWVGGPEGRFAVALSQEKTLKRKTKNKKKNWNFF
jgi:hypothetical protein